MKKLPAWTNRFVLPLLLSLLMTAVVSAISTIRVAGVDGLATHWLGAWAWSWVVAFPALLLLLPVVRWMVSKIVEEPEKNNDKTNS